jgi:hypothetical protein
MHISATCHLSTVHSSSHIAPLSKLHNLPFKQAYKDGLVSFKSSYRATFDGPLSIGDKVVEPTGAQAITDVELCTVGFDEAGLLRSFTAGAVVAKADEYKDPE